MLNFKNINEAVGYVRELSVAATEAMGNDEVWKYEPTGEILVGATANAIVEAEGAEDAANYRMIGLVREVLY